MEQFREIYAARIAELGERIGYVHSFEVVKTIQAVEVWDSNLRQSGIVLHAFGALTFPGSADRFLLRIDTGNTLSYTTSAATLLLTAGELASSYKC
jgi:hypothetical protein